MRSKEKIYESYLVSSARRGNRRSFDALVRYRGPKLFGHAYYLLGNREEARDAVQEAWVEITRGLNKLRDPSAFASWSYRIVSRCCARHISRNVADRTLTKSVEEMPEPEQPRNDDVHTILKAIKTLPPDQAETIRLFYLEEFSVREVSAALGIPQGTVKTRLMHARNTLKSKLEGDIDV